MRRHLYHTKNGCPAVTGIILTDDIKETILRHRIFHPSKNDKQSNLITNNTQNNTQTIINIFTSLPFHQKLDAYHKFKNIERIDLTTKIDNLFDDLIEQLQRNDFHRPLIEWTKDDYLNFIDKICTSTHPELQDCCVCSDNTRGHIVVFDDEWESQMDDISAHFIISKLFRYLLKYYELYLIRRSILCRNLRMKQDCKPLLETYFTFIGIFNIKPFIHDKCNADIIDDNNLSSYTISGEYESMYEKVRDTIKSSYKSQLMARVSNIVRNHTKTNAIVLNNKVQPLISDVSKCALTLYPNNFNVLSSSSVNHIVV
ncbi:MAG: hypothetical protein H9536_14260 [Aphanizomenon flos-aquae Clear-A1]|nr:hypothetical protein [Aphanizomenon flos-aquae Clear-A1]